MVLLAAWLLIVAQPVVPLEPTGKWSIDYGETACTLGRNYGPAAEPVVFGIQSLPVGEWVDLVISAKRSGPEFRIGTAEVSINGGPVTKAPYESFATRDSDRRVMRMSVTRSLFDGLPSRAVLRVTARREVARSFAIVGAKPALEALAKCNDDTGKLWGVDPLERQKLAVQASSDDRSDWITFADYPQSALRSGAQGTVIILWKVDENAKVASCRVVGTSGVPDLDTATCDAFKRRANYNRPALDHEGKPMAVHFTRKVVWRLP